jgi:hypothetical protein
MRKSEILAATVLPVRSSTQLQTVSVSEQVISENRNMAPSMAVAQGRSGRGSVPGARLR